MKIVISPAKSLDFESCYPEVMETKPIFLDRAKKIMKHLSTHSPNELQKLLSISSNLAQLNWKRNQEWNPNRQGRAAIYSFTGDVYKGISIRDLSMKAIKVMQDRLWIVSGLYGLLKPLDNIQAYRLEMGTHFKFGEFKNLYEFWSRSVTDKINEAWDDYLINLASMEYAKVIDNKALKSKMITPIFKEYKNGSLKTIGIFAKKARGAMVRYIVENNIDDIEKIKEFGAMGYEFSSNLSDEKIWTFVR